MNNPMAEARFEKAKTSVYWDIENFPVPKDCKAEEVADKISSALRKLNYHGPISISAYGNMNHIPPSVKKALSSTGIVLNHVHVYSRKYGLQVTSDIRYFQAPANVMVISHNEILPWALSWLQDGYNVLLAHYPHSEDSLVACAKTTWLWESLLKES